MRTHKRSGNFDIPAWLKFPRKPATENRYFSHIGQDMWVSQIFRNKQNGFFLDFGAFDGITASNTYSLEKYMKWNGILVEANPTYYPLVCRGRKSISVNAALWPQSRESIEMVDAHGLSSVSKYIDHDGPTVSESRKNITARKIAVDTVNPTELLERFQAPSFIEYLSLDVEGCEIDVLNSIDFTRYKFALMTIEHSEVLEKKDKIRAIIEPFGYKMLSRSYDFWVYHEAHIASLGGINDAESAFRYVDTNYGVNDLENPPKFDD